MNKLQKVDSLFRSSFDELVESIFQRPLSSELTPERMPLSNLGDYIDLYRDKKHLETRIAHLKNQIEGLTDELQTIEAKELVLRRNEKNLLQEKSMLKKACENKSLFLANMSHEIRTPMTGIMGSLEILQETDLSPDQKKYLKIIETCTHSLLAVVNDVLDYSKIEANELKIESIDFNLKEIISQVRDILIFKAQEKGIDFTTHIVHNVPIWLKGDPLRIRQVLLNLAGNAVKFTQSGHVAIEVTLESENDRSVTLLIKVKDTGAGISQEQQEQLFQCYSQINPEVTRRFGGTGLGLAISKKLTDLMNGRIGVESVEGEGSEFWFSVPLTKQVGTRKHQGDLFRIGQKPALAARTKHQNLSLLLVEDDVINQKIASILLEKEGFAVTVAENGSKALEILQSNMYDAILMDVEMPGLNGYETTRRIREMGTNSQAGAIPIIAMTAHAMSGDREKCLSAGMNDYISKPINIPVLSEILDRYLSQSNDSEQADSCENMERSEQVSIEFEKLNCLKAEVEDRFEFLVNVYLESIPQKLSAISHAINEKDRDRLRTAAHQLKGSSASFYAKKLVTLCQELESMATNPEQDPAYLQNHSELLHTEAEQVISLLKETFLS